MYNKNYKTKGNFMDSTNQEIYRIQGATEEIDALLEWLDSTEVNETGLRVHIQNRLSNYQDMSEKIRKQVMAEKEEFESRQ